MLKAVLPTLFLPGRSRKKSSIKPVSYTHLVTLAEPAPAGALVMVECNRTLLPGGGGSFGLAGSYTTADGQRHDMPATDQVINVTGTSPAEQLSSWLNQQDWVKAWNSNTVSYTHLDVYKRQPRRRRALPVRVCLPSGCRFVGKAVLRRKVESSWAACACRSRYTYHLWKSKPRILLGAPGPAALSAAFPTIPSSSDSTWAERIRRWRRSISTASCWAPTRSTPSLIHI